MNQRERERKKMTTDSFVDVSVNEMYKNNMLSVLVFQHVFLKCCRESRKVHPVPDA